jgi:hypothetical protein
MIHSNTHACSLYVHFLHLEQRKYKNEVYDEIKKGMSSEVVLY